MQDRKRILSQIPSVDELISIDKIAALTVPYPRKMVVEGIREYLRQYRKQIMGMSDKELAVFEMSEDLFIDGIVAMVHNQMKDKLVHVINASGVVLHTNLGRSILSAGIKEKLWETASHYSNLEMDMSTGERGSRYAHVEDLICKLTGAEAAMVVNNNAAAVMLVLNTIAKDKEVVVSRGQLVEIGGSFRVPDVMAQSGATLVEVGATNKTHIKDYADAANENTASFMKVHTSNYRILGFTEEVESAELVKLGKKLGLTVIEDLGSGVLIDLSAYGLPYEPTVQSAVKAGMDIVTFSGDKMLGGPQAGIIIGGQDYIKKMKKNPLTRAFRIDKLTLAALEGTLKLYLDEAVAVKEIPVLRMLTYSMDEINKRAKRLYTRLQKSIGSLCSLSLEDDFSEVGGGSLPMHKMPSKVIAISGKGISLDRLEKTLRGYDTPIIARINRDKYLLDTRTVQDDEFETINKALIWAFDQLKK